MTYLLKMNQFIEESPYTIYIVGNHFRIKSHKLRDELYMSPAFRKFEIHDSEKNVSYYLNSYAELRYIREYLYVVYKATGIYPELSKMVIALQTIGMLVDVETDVK